MFNATIKKFQLYNSSQTWQQLLKNKAVEKNGYRAHGDVKKAKAFVHEVSHYSFASIRIKVSEQIIFSPDVPLAFI